MTMRWPAMIGTALVIVLLLFWSMHLAIRAPEIERDPDPVIEGISVADVTEPPPTEEELMSPDSAPPPPPSAPPSLARPDLPSVAMPIPAAALDAGDVRMPVSLGSGGLNLGGSGAFGGFSGKGSGTGSGGYGTGKGFKGKPLIPLSTARPQMPEWACKQGVRGWVEVVFTVMPNGRVANVKLIDADPRGVFEAAAIESVSHWIYESHSKAREVKQKVAMNPEDCAYNWQ